MAKLVSTLIEEAGFRLDDPAHTRFTPKVIRSWINEGSREIARRAECLPALATTVVVAGTQDYTAPLNMVRIDQIEFEPTGDTQVFPLEFLERATASAITGTRLKSMQSYTPEYYSLWGTPQGAVTSGLTITLIPVTSVGGNLRIRYYRYPAEVSVTGSGDAGYLDLPEGWEDLTLDFCEYRCRRKDGDTNGATAAFNDFVNRMTALKETADRVYSSAPGQIMPEWGSGYFDGYW